MRIATLHVNEVLKHRKDYYLIVKIHVIINILYYLINILFTDHHHYLKTGLQFVNLLIIVVLVNWQLKTNRIISKSSYIYQSTYESFIQVYISRCVYNKGYQ